MPNIAPSARPPISVPRALAIALACWAVLALLDAFGAFAVADLEMLDARFRLRGPEPASEVVALVEIDDETIRAFGDRWPLPRSYVAALIAAAGEGGARAIGLDLFFREPDAYDTLSDSLLIIATTTETAVVHAVVFPPGESGDIAASTLPPSASLLRHGFAAKELGISSVSQVSLPFARLLDATKYIGHVSVAVDRDGAVRRAPLLLRYQDRLYPSLGLSLLQAGLEHGVRPTIRPRRGGLEIMWPSGRNVFVPVDREGATAIDFAGGRAAFARTYSMLQILRWSQAEEIDSLRDAFQGRIVLVGATSMTHVATDLGTTPYETATPLVYIHANLLNSLVQERFLYRMPWIVRWLFLAALALVLGYLAVSMPLQLALFGAIGGTLVLAGADFGLFLSDVDMPPTAGLLLPALVYSALQSYRVVFVERRERARAKEMAIAARIQRGLLPQTPLDHRYLDVFGTNEPALEVGGDYFDWIASDDGVTSIAVGDVEGKGIGASLLMAHLHASFHSESRSQRSASEVVDAMHRSLYRAADSKQFATFFLAQIDREGSRLRYCSAGHNPALHLRGAEVTWLDATGLPMGMIEDGPTYEERERTLAPGDVLVVYSDGITEYGCRNELYGEERLAKAVVRVAAGTTAARPIAEGILADVRAFARGGLAGDDVTLVVIRRLES